ncbi:MAG: hypothetical protein H7296_07055 [Bacteroidia bacterium]|nr:hypothetical protein [Bacteroidia bacterium]
MPLNSTFWGDYFKMLTGKYGIIRMMNFNEKQSKAQSNSPNTFTTL